MLRQASIAKGRRELEPVGRGALVDAHPRNAGDARVSAAAVHVDAVRDARSVGIPQPWRVARIAHGTASADGHIVGRGGGGQHRHGQRRLKLELHCVWCAGMAWLNRTKICQCGRRVLRTLRIAGSPVGFKYITKQAVLLRRSHPWSKMSCDYGSRRGAAPFPRPLPTRLTFPLHHFISH